MKYAVIAAVLAALLPSLAQADDGPWLVRGRAVNLAPADKSDPVGGTGAADRISVSSKVIPELDISYFFTPSVSAELVLTYPQKHTVRLDGADIGSFKHLPPTLLAQYHFQPGSGISPYLGAGVNYTRISNVHLLNNTASLDNSSTGLALQAGVDFKIDSKWSVNVDLKQVRIRSDVSVAGARISAVKIDPVLFGVGIGYRF